MKMDNFKYNDKTKDTITIANKGRTKIKDAQDILSKIDIPDDFTNSKKLKDSIDKLGMMNKLVNGSNELLNNAIKTVLAAEKDAFGGLMLGKTKYIGFGKYSYEDLDNMSYDELNKFLGDKVLNSPVLQTLKNGLDENNDPYILRRTKDMYKLYHRIFNVATPDSVCQGGAYIGNGMIAYCDIDSKKDCGKLHIVVNNQKYKPNPTCEIISSIDVNGHSNDITYIPKDNIIIHPDHAKKEINLYQIDKDTYEITKIKTIKDRNADAIAYDSEKDKIIAINATDAEVYSREDYISGDKQPESKFKVADQIKDTRDEDDCTYYNYRAGATAYDGVLYLSYSGFEEDKEYYEPEDTLKTNMITVVDYEQGGTPIGQIKDNIPQEVESIDHDENGDLIYFSNYGPKTRVFKTKLVNTKVIAENYKKDTAIKAKKK